MTELDRLEATRDRVEQIVRTEHYLMHEGQPVRDPDTGEPLTDGAPRLAAMDLALEITDAIWRLNGIEGAGPVITADEAESRLRSLEQRAAGGS